MVLTDIANNNLLKRERPSLISLPFIGLLISGLLVGCGLIFSTYTISMPSTLGEAARQLGLPFVVAEVFIILFAIRNGLNLAEIWRGLALVVRLSIALFICLYWVGAAFFSETGTAPFVQNAITLIHLIFCAAVFHILAPITPSGMRGMANGLAIGMMIFCVMTAVAFISHPPLSAMPNNEIIWQFAIPGFISLRLFGAFCAAVFCFLFVQLLIDDEQDNKQTYQYLWLILSAGMVIWSGTRAAVVGIAVAISLIAIAYKLRPKAKTLTAISGSIILAAGLAVLLIPYGDTNFMLWAPEDVESAENLSGGRLSYWWAIWQAYQTVPYFGAGPFASFWILPAGQMTHVQPHNIFLQFLITWGALATVPALFILAYGTWKVHAIAMKQRITLPFLTMLDCLLVMSLFDGIMHFAQHLMLLMICFGAIFSVTKMLENRAISK